MLSLILHAVTCVWFLPACVSAVTTETVVGVAGRRVMLPCRSEAVSQRGVEVCWGRGEPSLFTCHNTVINTAEDQATYRKSYRYSVSSSSSLIIYNLRQSDSGFYHCRVQLPGLFNDQTSTVHLIVITPRSVVSDSSETGTSELPDKGDDGNLNAPRTTTNDPRGDMTEAGSDVTGPMVALVQSSVQQVSSLQSFIGNTVRVSFIIFIPALLLSAAYRVWWSNQRTETNGGLNQSEEEKEEEEEEEEGSV
ncbi:hepatitis A virus cellular receptor 2 homolog [Pempheris klunzingeri]|uniref:hepatitis A virus cellular receptor 2 homolog n=1 Tax=Pempheris klunzingeri TaxID=3127111 RepID=UPI0039804F59